MSVPVSVSVSISVSVSGSVPIVFKFAGQFVGKTITTVRFLGGIRMAGTIYGEGDDQ